MSILAQLEKKNKGRKMHPNYIVTEPKILYIDRYGNIYPDCKTYCSSIIGHISDENIVDSVLGKIFSAGEKRIFNMVTVEFSSACHAKCFYCFQEDGKRGERYLYFGQLMDFLLKINTYWLFFSGGEILDQPDAMGFISDYRKRCPHTWIHLKTNGNADLKYVDFVGNCCNSAMISFNGFSEASCRTLMDVDIRKTINFCENIKENTQTNLGVKFLNSPICVAEAPNFMDWALKLNAKAIAIQTVYQYSFDAKGSSSREKNVFEGLHSEYWDNIIQRTSRNIEYVIRSYKDKINQDTRYLSADKMTMKILQFDSEIQKMFRTDGVYIIE